MDEVFGKDNFRNDITRIKSNPKNFYRKAYGNEKDLILFYTKNYKENIWNDIRVPLDENEIADRFNKIDENGRRYTTIPYMHQVKQNQDQLVIHGKEYLFQKEDIGEQIQKHLIRWMNLD